MSGVYNMINAQCPYYVYENPQKKEIQCHGIIPDTFITQKFRRRAEYDAQISTFCDKSYWQCEYCCALDGYWQTAD